MKSQGDTPELVHLWVLPEAMGRGVGRSLFLHAVDRARALKLPRIEIESDPNAEPFYEGLGARRLRTVRRDMDRQRRDVPIMVYEIRPKTKFQPVHSEEQIAEVVRLAREIWQEHYLPIIGQQQVDYMLETFQSPGALAKQISEGYEYYLAAQDGLNAGYLAILTNLRDSSLLLSKLYVRKATRGLGLGKDMLKFVEDLCSKRGIKTIWLTVNKNNAGSIAWYSRMGFCNVGPVVADIGGGFIMDDFKMEKVL